ncbi:poly-gamma-glutamate synthase PgsB [bacterium]|nr:poly-gamma-glutamate synthase PgsB [bacterium]
MGTYDFLLILTLLVVAAGLWEYVRHKMTLSRVPIRIHVNGTRGKSSVTRLIAAGLREAGIRTSAKTTGTLARMIFPDGREVPVFRPSGANVIEQIRIVAAAAANKSKALVVECMALQPDLQYLCESKFIRATHGVVTNAREDHLDVMGPGEREVALALAGMTPIRGKMFTSDRRHVDVFKAAADERKSQFVAIGEEDISSVTVDDLAGFSYTEHPDNVALSLAVLKDLGVDRETAIRGMWKLNPDPGAMTEHPIHFFGRDLVFVNGFAANDPESTEQIWNLAIGKHPRMKTRIAIFNCRSDRPDRSRQLGQVVAKWTPPDKIVLVGTGTYIFAREAVKGGVDIGKIVFAEDLRVEEIFETVIGLIPKTALVMGMGNIGGIGLEIVRFFKNREAPKED